MAFFSTLRRALGMDHNEYMEDADLPAPADEATAPAKPTPVAAPSKTDDAKSRQRHKGGYVPRIPAGSNPFPKVIPPQPRGIKETADAAPTQGPVAPVALTPVAAPQAPDKPETAPLPSAKPRRDPLDVILHEAARVFNTMLSPILAAKADLDAEADYLRQNISAEARDILTLAAPDLAVQAEQRHQRALDAKDREIAELRAQLARHQAVEAEQARESAKDRATVQALCRQLELAMSDIDSAHTRLEDLRALTDAHDAALAERDRQIRVLRVKVKDLQTANALLAAKSHAEEPSPAARRRVTVTPELPMPVEPLPADLDGIHWTDATADVVAEPVTAPKPRRAPRRRRDQPQVEATTLPLLFDTMPDGADSPADSVIELTLDFGQ